MVLNIARVSRDIYIGDYAVSKHAIDNHLELSCSLSCSIRRWDQPFRRLGYQSESGPEVMNCSPDMIGTYGARPYRKRSNGFPLS